MKRLWNLFTSRNYRGQRIIVVRFKLKVKRIKWIIKNLFKEKEFGAEVCDNPFEEQLPLNKLFAETDDLFS